MAHETPVGTQLRPLQAILDADSVLQEIVRGSLWPDPKKKAVDRRLREIGFRAPKGYTVDIHSGRLVREPQRARWWMYPLVGAGFAAPELIGLLASGGGAAGASAGAGGAVTPAEIAAFEIPRTAIGGPAVLGSALGTAAAGGLGNVGQSAANAAANAAAKASVAEVIAKLAGVLPLGLAAFGGGPTVEERGLQQRAERLLALQEGRLARQEPLHEAVTQLAFSLLPRRP